MQIPQSTQERYNVNKTKTNNVNNVSGNDVKRIAHYLAEKLDDYIVKNKDDPKVFKPNFKGFMVGNGVTDW